MRFRSILVFFLLTFNLSIAQSKDEFKYLGYLTEEGLNVWLDSIWTAEQIPIRKRDSLGRIHGFESEEFNWQDKIYHQNHDINEKKIRELLDTHGWPEIRVIGDRGNITICNVIQHSENEVRIMYLPMMREAVASKNLDPALLARAEDRIATERGDLQIYGTQIKYYPETQSLNLWPIKNPENLEKRRAEIGLEPIEAFLRRKRVPMEWNVEEQIERTREFEKNKKQKPV
ncbi:DUF6624 domain-containing protein [Algoriphagus sediminis]|uniref:Uncharacterized protein n=1 Tax=Algoriphagus sediminis TaxID=3057113 RepID=A0ABT7YBD2_9BACT|nr:DUF6624 domain-containing protein [Algoriphagus sediminis]MDN3203823.1 hypothetical protein [Algoriphagus sediminis]